MIFITWFFLVMGLTVIFSLEISVNTSEASCALKKFWRSTGFSSNSTDVKSTREFLLSQEVKTNLLIISSLPGNGIQYVRIHWLLSLLRRTRNKTIIWDDLDEVIERIVRTGLTPIVELMGNSSFLRQKRPNIRPFWKNLTSDIITRYEGKYGEEVLQWKFETWNEPDLEMYNVIGFDVTDFLEYTIGCAEGVRSTHLQIEFGGPAGLFKLYKNHPLCYGFLDYCNKDEHRCYLDYISFHKKGNGTISGIINGSIGIRDMLESKYQNIASTPIVNDEADILSGWWRVEEWRGDVRYAAAVVRTVLEFNRIAKVYNVQRISIDNGFINVPSIFFNQRTLLTRFWYFDDRSSFIQKPVYAAMGLLGLLGDEEFAHVNYTTDNRLSVIATCTRNSLSKAIESIGILMGFVDDDVNTTSSKDKVDLRFTVFLPTGWVYHAKYALYKLENTLPHPRKVWEKMVYPINPTKKELLKLQSVQGPHRVQRRRVKKQKLVLWNYITKPSVALLQICKDLEINTRRVTDLKVYNITFNEVLLTWKVPKGDERCIKTYSVEHSIYAKGPFRRVNPEDIIYNSYTYIYENYSSYNTEDFTAGFYRLASVDFWGRVGHYSRTVVY